MPDLSRIDAHHHLWDPARRRHAWLDGDDAAPIRRAFGVDDLAAVTAPAGVTATVLVQALDEPAESADALATAARTELIAGVVGWIDLAAGPGSDPDADIAALRSLPGGDKLVGIRFALQSLHDTSFVDRADVRRAVAAVGRAGLVYDLLTRSDQLDDATRLVRALPGVQFVLDHLSKPPVASGELEPWRSRLTDLSALPNVVCKLSGLVTEADPAGWTTADLAPYADTVFAAFGPDRVMFGSDWPVCLLAGGYDRVVATTAELIAGLGPADQAAVWALTARRVYGLA